MKMCKSIFFVLLLSLLFALSLSVSAITVEEWKAVEASCHNNDQCKVNYWTPQITQACNNDVTCVALIKAFRMKKA